MAGVSEKKYWLGLAVAVVAILLGDVLLRRDEGMYVGVVGVVTASRSFRTPVYPGRSSSLRVYETGAEEVEIVVDEDVVRFPGAEKVGERVLVCFRQGKLFGTRYKKFFLPCDNGCNRNAMSLGDACRRNAFRFGTDDPAE